MKDAEAGEHRPLRVLWRSRLGSERVAESGWPAELRVEVEVDEERARPRAHEVDVLVDGAPTDELLDGAELRHVVVPYAGIRARLREQMRARSHLTLHNSHFNAAFVAQHGSALLLACAQRIAAYDRALRRGEWGERDGPESIHLEGKRALLVGYGAIGRAWAPRVAGLGMTLRAVRRNPRPDAEPPQVGLDRLREALGEADAVLVSLPETPETTGLFDDAAFGAMQPGSLLVNVGRGPVIDAWALHRALASGRLAGAGLDVWWRYPEGDQQRRCTRPAEPPLEEHENLVMSPHRANQVADWQAASIRDVRETLGALARGELDRNRVDPARGY